MKLLLTVRVDEVEGRVQGSSCAFVGELVRVGDESSVAYREFVERLKVVDDP